MQLLLLSGLLMSVVQMDDSSPTTMACIHFPSIDPEYGHNMLIISQPIQENNHKSYKCLNVLTLENTQQKQHFSPL